MKLEGKGVLVMTAVQAERDAVLRGLQNSKRFDVQVAGVGPVAAAVNTARALTGIEYDLVVCAGIGGGFPGQAEVGSLVVADKIVAADLGVETPEGFCSLDEMNFGSSCIEADAHLTKSLVDALAAVNMPVTVGPVLTVSTATGTAASAAKMTRRVAGATAEAMEGFGVAFAAANFGLPVLELRSVSNLVGPRNRNSWRINEALDLLAKASSIFLEVF